MFMYIKTHTLRKSQLLYWDGWNQHIRCLFLNRLSISFACLSQFCHTRFVVVFQNKASDSNCIIESLPDSGMGEDDVGCGQEYTDSVTASICVVTLSCSFSLVSLAVSDCGTYLRAVVWLGSVCHMPWVSQWECPLMCERDPRCLRRSSQFISVDTPPNSCPHLDTHSSSTHFHMLLPLFPSRLCWCEPSCLCLCKHRRFISFFFFDFFPLTY